MPQLHIFGQSLIFAWKSTRTIAVILKRGIVRQAMFDCLRAESNFNHGNNPVSWEKMSASYTLISIFNLFCWTPRVLSSPIYLSLVHQLKWPNLDALQVCVYVYIYIHITFQLVAVAGWPSELFPCLGLFSIRAAAICVRSPSNSSFSAS